MIDIVELLEDYVRLLEAGGIERTSTDTEVLPETHMSAAGLKKMIVKAGIINI